MPKPLPRSPRARLLCEAVLRDEDHEVVSLVPDNKDTNTIQPNIWEPNWMSLSFRFLATKRGYPQNKTHPNKESSSWARLQTSFVKFPLLTPIKIQCWIHDNASIGCMLRLKTEDNGPCQRVVSYHKMVRFPMHAKPLGSSPIYYIDSPTAFTVG